jgi:hypothetical protein
VTDREIELFFGFVGYMFCLFWLALHPYIGFPILILYFFWGRTRKRWIERKEEEEYEKFHREFE